MTQKVYVSPECLQALARSPPITKLKQKSYALMRIKQGDRVLDVGCGPGIDTVPMAKLVTPMGRVVGIDSDPVMIDAANTAAVTANVSGWSEHRVADTGSLPFPEGYFSSCRCERVFQHLTTDEVTAAVREMFRVTAPGGWVSLIDTDWGTLSIDSDDAPIERTITRIVRERFPNPSSGVQLLRRLVNAGFVDLKIQSIAMPMSLPAMSFFLSGAGQAGLARGWISEAQWRTFLIAQQEASRRGGFYAHFIMVLAAGRKPGDLQQRRRHASQAVGTVTERHPGASEAAAATTFLPAAGKPAAGTSRRLRRIVTAEAPFASTLGVSPAFDGQDPQALLGRFTEGGHLPPSLSLDFLTLHDGYFWIGPGQDGVLFARDGKPIVPSLTFRSSMPFPDRAALSQQAVKLDFDAFVAVDPEWNNYYHWLCLAIPKMLAARAAKAAFRPVVPDYSGRKQLGWKLAYGETVWEQSLAVSDLADHVVRLPPGIYTCALVGTIIVDHWQPAFFSCFDGFTKAYENIRQKLRTRATSPRRILVKRRDNKRMTEEESELVEAVARANAFTTIQLEDLDFIAQAELFFNAEAVIAAHGAGLGNIVFGGKELSVLEINRRLSPRETHLRPWFFLIARDKGQYYSFLDAGAGDLERGKIEAGVRRLLASAGGMRRFAESGTDAQNV